MQCVEYLLSPWLKPNLDIVRKSYGHLATAWECPPNRMTQLSVQDGELVHEKVRILTAPNPREYLDLAKAPNFFAAVRRRGLRKNRVHRCSN